MARGAPDWVVWSVDINVLGGEVVGPTDLTFVKFQTAAPATTRQTVITPASGKRIAVFIITLLNGTATITFTELYFGTGANIDTDGSKAIAMARIGNGEAAVGSQYSQQFLEGKAPIGDVDEVVSLRYQSNVGTSGGCIIGYLEV